jgi:hypothetical protein
MARKSNTPVEDSVAASSVVSATTREVASKVAASNDQISIAATGLPDSCEKTIITAESGLVKKVLPKPEPADVKLAEARVEAVKTGDKERSDKLYAQALEQMTGMTQSLAKAQTELDQSLKSAAKNTADMQGRIDELQRQLSEKETRFMVVLISSISAGIGLIALLITAAGVYFRMMNARVAAVAGLLGLASALGFSFARFLTHAWLPWAVAGVAVLCTLSALGVWLYDFYHRRKEADGVEALAQQAHIVTQTAEHIVGAIEDAGKTPEIQQLKGVLRDKLDTAHKSVVRQLQAKKILNRKSP